ncbi:hypothetical protein D2Q93_08210 [Alicyclobacillaceae bacterium I2511]|jgi:hypothetical protein|nr:hypothetical protein D2Q93_08210 [Alicyclobacillaceae bacterium I2511]
MGFFHELENIAQGMGMNNGEQQPNLPDHLCHQCHIPMQYHGAHTLRTGGLSRGTGFVTDLLLGGRDEEYLNTAMEKNVVLHVFVCNDCGRVELINDPHRGF